MAKTRRFGDLVRESGRPEVVTLWVDPEKDRSFSKAMRENRVMTVESDPASHRKEHGEIGFRKAEGAIYLVFPRALPRDTDSRIVGINYQLTEDRPVTDPVPDVTRVARVKKPKPELKKETPPPPPKPELKTFEVTLRRIATVDEKLHVKAETEDEAKQEALERIKAKRFANRRAEVRDEVVDVRTS